MPIRTRRERAMESIQETAVTMKTVASETNNQHIKESCEDAVTVLGNALETLKQKEE